MPSDEDVLFNIQDSDSSSQDYDLLDKKKPSLIDLDFDFEEKPWRKPGQDITDYFNYGFDEKSWRNYLMKKDEGKKWSNKRK